MGKTYIRYISRLSLICGLLIITGCATVGPDYVRPDTSMSTIWHSQLKGGLATDETDPKSLAAWWSTLNDPELSSLVERAVADNLDLKKAGARVRESRARRRLANADLFPTLDATGNANRRRSSEDTGGGMTAELYSVGFDAGWELDIFGGVRRSVEASQADLEASREDMRDVLVSLLAEVALNYVEARTLQQRLAVVEANLAVQNETYQLTLWRHQAGLSDELAVKQALYNLESTRSQMPTLRTGLEEAMNRIAVLLGEQPGKVHEELKSPAPIPAVPPKVAVGIPADAMRRRPDVRRAERNLAAQTARIGVAAADLYPKFKLSGAIGLEALTAGSLFSAGKNTNSIGAGITLPIFHGGAIRQNIEVQSALQEQYLIAYETAVLTALEEVENAIVAYAEEQQRRQSLSEAMTAAHKAAELAQYKYQSGLSDFGSVLDAQRSLLSFQDQMAQSSGTVTSNLVRLYKALGGGWSSLAQDDKK